MPKSHQRMAKDHPRTCKSHHLAYIFAMHLLRAMYLTYFAREFILSQRATLHTSFIIGSKLFTLLTQTIPKLMMSLAIDAYHRAHNPFFILYSIHANARLKFFPYDFTQPAYNTNLTHGLSKLRFSGKISTFISMQIQPFSMSKVQIN